MIASNPHIMYRICNARLLCTCVARMQQIARPASKCCRTLPLQPSASFLNLGDNKCVFMFAC